MIYRDPFVVLLHENVFSGLVLDDTCVKDIQFHSLDIWKPRCQLYLTSFYIQDGYYSLNPFLTNDDIIVFQRSNISTQLRIQKV